MVAYLKRVLHSVVEAVISTPLQINRTEWIYIFFLALLIGFLCLRGGQKR